MLYLIQTEHGWKAENRTHPIVGSIEGDPNVPWVECYEFFKEDGQWVALVSERKLADKMNEMAARENANKR